MYLVVPEVFGIILLFLMISSAVNLDVYLQMKDQLFNIYLQIFNVLSHIYTPYLLTFTNTLVFDKL